MVILRLKLLIAYQQHAINNIEVAVACYDTRKVKEEAVSDLFILFFVLTMKKVPLSLSVILALMFFPPNNTMYAIFFLWTM